MCICVFTNKTTFRTKQIHIRRCAKEKTFAETEKGHLCICVSVFSQQNHSLSTFAKSTIAGMRLREISTKKRILCGYASADQVLQHARRMGSICLLVETPFKEGVLQLSLDRSLDRLMQYITTWPTVFLSVHI
jgi:hypothetical protein